MAAVWKQLAHAESLVKAQKAWLAENAACTFHFTFKGESLELAQEGGDSDCGFGAGGYAGGTYTRSDKIIPQAVEFEADY